MYMMIFFILFTIFISIPRARTASLLTGSIDPNSTVLINERRDTKEIDVLRQIINQETLIRLSVVKDVKAVVDDVSSMKHSLGSMQKTVETLKRQVDTLNQENKYLNSTVLRTIKKGLKPNTDCMDLYMNGHTQSGVYRINTFGNESQINVYCDMETEGGGWTAIQKRRNGRVSFNKTWAEYKTGFGNTSDSYWIGNDVIHQLTKGRNSFLYISITRKDDIKYYELYDQFAVADESDNYTLFLGGPYMGTLGDNMLDTGYTFYDLSGMSFSTPDRDNDRKREENCASEHNGGWWFNKCHYAYLNGPWYPERWTYPWVFKFYDGSKIKETTMMIKPH